MYKPTEQELLEMGFKNFQYTFWDNCVEKYVELGVYPRIDVVGKKYTERLSLTFVTNDEGISTWAIGERYIIRPSSKSDIETLIRLFSKP